MWEWFKSLFITKSLPRDEELKQIFERSEKYEIKEFTPSGIMTILQDDRTSRTAIFVCARDATTILTDDDFANFFDPVSQIVRLERGTVGSIWALPVISDQRFANRFLDKSYVVNLSYSDFEIVYD